MGVGTLTVPVGAFLNNEPLAMTTVGAVVAVVGGSAACSLALQYYASRYVGEMSLVSGTAGGAAVKVRLSTMDFWGHRVDTDVPVDDIVPPLADLPPGAVAEIASQMFLPLDVAGSHQHILSIRHGLVKDKPRLLAVLSGAAVEMPKMGASNETRVDRDADAR